MERPATDDGKMRLNTTPAALLGARHSRDFVAAWRSVWCGVFGWRREGPFAAVPSPLGSRALAYVPGLSYTDLTVAEAGEMAREARGRRFNVRALGAPEAAEGLADGAAAVLRLNLAAHGHDIETVWRALPPTCRNRVRKARAAGLAASEEAGAAGLHAFHAMLRMALARHGAPMPPAALFDALAAEMGARMLVARGADGQPRASLLWLRDGPLAWVPWVGGGGGQSREPAGNLLFWTWIEQALSEGAGVADFGRSAKGQGTWAFKRSFGATPVPVAWLSDKPANLHRRYALAQRAWLALPNAVADRMGPKACRYLADY